MSRSIFRKPSIKRSFKARTTGRIKRSVKSSVDPFYGRKGMGVRHPRRSAYNAVYHRTSVDTLKPLKNSSRSRSNSSSYEDVQDAPSNVDHKIWHWIAGIAIIAIAWLIGNSLLSWVGGSIAVGFVGFLVICYLIG